MAFTRVCCRPFAIILNGLGAIAPVCKVCKKVVLVCTSGRSIDRFHPLDARFTILTCPVRSLHGLVTNGISNGATVVARDVQVRCFYTDMKNI